MSEADRVFARMTSPGPQPEPESQVLHLTTRRRGAVAGQTRTVEVVHHRSDRAAAAPPPANPPTASSHAATWPDGFPARPVPTSPLTDAAAATPTPAPPVGHLMPGWEPLLPPLAPAPASELPAPRQAPPKAIRPALPRVTKRGFADPFATEDTGANCRRCGYLVEAGREKRGLMTCASCG